MQSPKNLARSLPNSIITQKTKCCKCIRKNFVCLMIENRRRCKSTNERLKPWIAKSLQKWYIVAGGLFFPFHLTFNVMFIRCVTQSVMTMGKKTYDDIAMKELLYCMYCCSQTLSSCNNIISSRNLLTPDSGNAILNAILCWLRFERDRQRERN